MFLGQNQLKLMKKAKLACILLQFTPFIRMVALNGSLARGEANENSDIDFLIIAKNKRIWTTRAISFLIMAAFGLKRYENKIKGRVCLNLYQTDNHLTLTTQNKILARSHAYTVPLWQTDHLFKRFASANSWIKNYGKSFLFDDYVTENWERVVAQLISWCRFLGEFLFDLILNDWGENLLKKYQTNRIMSDRRTLRSKAGEIFLSDEELRFHPDKS